MDEKKFLKFNQGKLQYGLIPPLAVKSMAEIFTYGATKYGPDNWKLCKDATAYWDALHRHLQAYALGEHVDQETGYSHLAHALANMAMLVHFDCRTQDTFKQIAKEFADAIEEEDDDDIGF